MARAVILTGAGISQESGLATFRDLGGIWATVKLEEVATPDAFAADPARVQDFYNARRRQLLSPPVAPNAAHQALAELERHWAGGFLLVTQNIDDLHERAGSRKMIHLHGELLKAICTYCGQAPACQADLDSKSVCPACGKTGRLRPRVVWFGEMPLEMEKVYAALTRCDLFVSIGTSGNVYPAAQFVDAARVAGADTVELNLEPSAGASRFARTVYGQASQVVPEFVRTLLATQDGRV